jgi:hypothetical protein
MAVDDDPLNLAQEVAGDDAGEFLARHPCQQALEASAAVYFFSSFGAAVVSIS